MTRPIVTTTNFGQQGVSGGRHNKQFVNNTKSVPTPSYEQERDEAKLRQPYEFPRRGNSTVVKQLSSVFNNRNSTISNTEQTHRTAGNVATSTTPTATRKGSMRSTEDESVFEARWNSTTTATTASTNDTNVVSMLYPSVHHTSNKSNTIVVNHATADSSSNRSAGFRKNSDRTSSTLSSKSYGSFLNKQRSHNNDEEGSIINTSFINNNNISSSSNVTSSINILDTILLRTTPSSPITSSSTNNNSFLLNNSSATRTTVSTVSGHFTPDSSIEYEKEPSPEDGALQFIPALDIISTSNNTHNNPTNSTLQKTKTNEHLVRSRISNSNANTTIRMNSNQERLVSKQTSATSSGFVSRSQRNNEGRTSTTTSSNAFVPSWDELLVDVPNVEKKKPETIFFHQSSADDVNNHDEDKNDVDVDEAKRNRIIAHEQQRQQKYRETKTNKTPQLTTSTTAPVMTGSRPVLGSSKTSATTTTSNVVANRIARLASMFSSRATVQTERTSNEAATPISSATVLAASQAKSVAATTLTPSPISTTSSGTSTAQSVPFVSQHHHQQQQRHYHQQSQQPISPAQSSSSSAYVDWPGTQNKRGHTISYHNPYDDSSLSATGTPASSTTPQHQDTLYHHQSKEMQAAALREMRSLADAVNSSKKDGFSAIDMIVDRGGLSPQAPTVTSPTTTLSNSYNNRRRRHSSGELLKLSNTVTEASNHRSAAEYHLAAAVADATKHRPSTTGCSTSSSTSSSIRFPTSSSSLYRHYGRDRTSFDGDSGDNGGKLNQKPYETTIPLTRASVTLQPNCWSSESSSSGGNKSAGESDVDFNNVGITKSKSFSEYVQNSAVRGKTTSTTRSSSRGRINDESNNGNGDRRFKGTTVSDSGTNSNNYSWNTSNKEPFRSQLAQHNEHFGDGVSGRRGRVASVGSTSKKIVPPTEIALAANDLLAPPHRTFPNSVGYRGLLDKTKEVPSLFDTTIDSDSVSSSTRTASVFSGTTPMVVPLGLKNLIQNHQHHPLSLHHQHQKFRGPITVKLRPEQPWNRPVVNSSDSLDMLSETESDVFDGLSLAKESNVFDNLSNSTSSPRKKHSHNNHRDATHNQQLFYPSRIAEEDDSTTSSAHNRGLDNNGDENNNIGINKDNNNQSNNDHFKIVTLASGITTIQSSDLDYSKRRTASDFDEHLSTSEVSSNGYTRIPGLKEMISAGTKRDNSLHGIVGNIGLTSSSSSSASQAQRNARSNAVTTGATHLPESQVKLLLQDDTANMSYVADSDVGNHSFSTVTDGRDNELAKYRVETTQMKKLLNRYRELSELFDTDMTLEEFEKEEDEHKAFALLEMRSRIMEKDIERGLERRGGTCVVDDIVTTTYQKTCHRIRDAVIVCKAWRDGATISDVVKASLLGHRHTHVYYIRRRISNTDPRSSNNNNNSQYCYSGSDASTITGTSSSYNSLSMSSAGSHLSSSQRNFYYWEPVQWLDDTDVMLFRCPSVVVAGSRNMRGFEIFTIGDCQSILLKLTNERCMELRKELNEATVREIEAEEMLKKEEVDHDFNDEMTEVEVAYLTSMEEVKLISKKLVHAEQAFALVRDRIKKLIAKYENILIKIETESSIVSNDDSFYSDYSSAYWEALEEREREMWARRARRAEIRAEIAAREAHLAKQETRMVQEVKQRELDILKQKLLEIQSEASSSSHSIDRDHSYTLANTLAKQRHEPLSHTTAVNRNNTYSTPSNETTVRNMQEIAPSRLNNDKVQDVKQRFRERMAIKKQQEINTTSTMMMTFQSSSSSPLPPQQQQRLSSALGDKTTTPTMTTPATKTGNSVLNNQYNRNHNNNNSNNTSSKAVLFRSAGEEMFQQMDFYERSLNSIDRTRL